MPSPAADRDSLPVLPSEAVVEALSDRVGPGPEYQALWDTVNGVTADRHGYGELESWVRMNDLPAARAGVELVRWRRHWTPELAEALFDSRLGLSRDPSGTVQYLVANPGVDGPIVVQALERLESSDAPPNLSIREWGDDTLESFVRIALRRGVYPANDALVGRWRARQIGRTRRQHGPTGAPWIALLDGIRDLATASAPLRRRAALDTDQPPGRDDQGSVLAGHPALSPREWGRLWADSGQSCLVRALLSRLGTQGGVVADWTPALALVPEDVLESQLSWVLTWSPEKGASILAHIAPAVTRRLLRARGREVRLAAIRQLGTEAQAAGNAEEEPLRGDESSAVPDPASNPAPSRAMRRR